MLLVNVTHFDDMTSSTGEVVTVYVVNVKYSFKSAYSLSKRYSDFSDLYNVMKDFLPLHYKFPNKSMFNSSAQFTKERRIKGFDELLKILMKIEPFPVQLQRFLEMQERVSIGSKENFVFLTYPTSTSNSNDLIRDNKGKNAGGGSANTLPNSRTISAELPKLDSRYKESNKHGSRDDQHLEKAINVQVKRNFPGVVSSSFKIALVVYILCVVLSIVDVSSTSLSQMLVTLLALGLLFAFIRIINFKIESRNARKVATE
jgi:hypothetical protein